MGGSLGQDRGLFLSFASRQVGPGLSKFPFGLSCAPHELVSVDCGFDCSGFKFRSTYSDCSPILITSLYSQNNNIFFYFIFITRLVARADGPSGIGWGLEENQ
jgi:hypothetical protein